MFLPFDLLSGISVFQFGDSQGVNVHLKGDCPGRLKLLDSLS